MSGDLALEARLRALHASAAQSAHAEWLLGAARARAAANLLSAAVEIHRPPVVPLRSVTCPVCGLATGWEWVARPRADLVVRAHERKWTNRVETRGESLLRVGQWQYAVREASNGR